jgi:murein DD-endopeptidase MepM/ murein hydrolase activator NlpD
MASIDKLLSLGSRSRLFSGASRKNRIVSAAALFLAVCAFGAAGVAPMAPDPADLPVTALVQELALPDLQSQIASLEPTVQTFVSEEVVRSGDTLASIMQRLGIDDDAAEKFIKSDGTAYRIMQLRPGKRIQAQTTASGELQWLSATVAGPRGSMPKAIVITRAGDGFKAMETAAELEKRIEMRSGEIRSSLFAATDNAQIPDAVAMQIVDMFSTDIDFASDLRRGDRFNVVYETFWQDGEFIRAGRILAAEFRNGKQDYESVWFDESGTGQGGGYYALDGKSLKKAFLKSPLEFSRISSGFSIRVHPISGQWKRHKGVDFAAATGTPIRAAGDGEIDFLGTQNGYGNTVVIQHWSKYTTLYAHMSRFAPGLRKGSKIRQGEVIGYVGTTGWSTGPHLHYEFRVNNEPRDPMSVDVPNAQPLAGAALQRFRTQAGDMAHRFALLNPDSGIKLAAQ